MSFVRRDGELLAAPPYRVEMSDVFAFVLAAERATLQALCDRELNLGPLHHAPLGDFVIFYGARIANRAQGTLTRTREMGVWVPVVRDGRLLTYSPYVWVDSSTSMHVGREVFGYPKQVGSIALPSDEGPAVLEAAGDTLATRSGERLVARDRLVRIQGPGTWDRPSGPRKWLELIELGFDVTKELLHLQATLEELASLLGGMRSVFLKQLPSPGGSQLPDFQSLVETAVKPDLLSLGGDVLEGTWTVSVPSYEEPRIAETLGLRGGIPTATWHDFVALGQGWLQLEGELEAGEEVWRRI